MDSTPPRDTNPYAAPRVGDAAVDAEPDVRLGVYKPRISPRNVSDVLYGFIMGVPAGLAVLGLPILLVNFFGLPPVLIPVSLLLIFAMAMIVLASGIREVIVSEEGITVRRSILPRVFFRWDELTRIRSVGRMEAFLIASFRPNRTCPYSFTYLDHVCVETRRGYFIFPPEHVATRCRWGGRLGMQAGRLHHNG